MKKITRRNFIKRIPITISGSLFAACSFKEITPIPTNGKNIETPSTSADSPVPAKTDTIAPPKVTASPTISQPDPSAIPVTPTKTYIPMVSTPANPTILNSKVVQVYSANATSWNYSTGWYGDYVNQDVVYAMFDEGIKQLTGQSSVASAWQNILPNYSPGKAIAVKVNFNNSGRVGCDGKVSTIDALIEPVNALIRSLKTIGVHEEDLWVYDSTRKIPEACFMSKCLSLYPKVRFFGLGACGETAAGWESNDPSAIVKFNHPNGIFMPTIRISDVLINATYLINMPILKNHGNPGVSLTFKNHFGTIDHPDQLHDYILPSGVYTADYSPFVDIYLNPHIVNKTILIVGDGLFGAKNYDAQPQQWASFGDSAPNSLFFSLDPVAIDSVMYDFVNAELQVADVGDDYLRLASRAGLGIFEHGDPWGTGYTKIPYQKVNM